MELALKTLPKPFAMLKSRVMKEKAVEQDPLIFEMNEVRQKIQGCQNQFDASDDDDLIDSYIYELESLQARYRYLIKQAKKKNLCCEVASQMRLERMERQWDR